MDVSNRLSGLALGSAMLAKDIAALFVVAIVFAWILEKRAEWFGAHPAITPGWVRTFAVDWACTSAKAERELGYRPTPLAEGVQITYQWLQRVRKEQA